jgi:hypothetical protein
MGAAAHGRLTRASPLEGGHRVVRGERRHHVVGMVDPASAPHTGVRRTGPRQFRPARPRRGRTYRASRDVGGGTGAPTSSPSGPSDTTRSAGGIMPLDVLAAEVVMKREALRQGSCSGRERNDPTRLDLGRSGGAAIFDRSQCHRRSSGKGGTEASRGCRAVYWRPPRKAGRASTPSRPFFVTRRHGAPREGAATFCAAISPPPKRQPAADPGYSAPAIPCSAIASTILSGPGG